MNVIWFVHLRWSTLRSKLKMVGPIHPTWCGESTPSAFAKLYIIHHWHDNILILDSKKTTGTWPCHQIMTRAILQILSLCPPCTLLATEQIFSPITNEYCQLYFVDRRQLRKSSTVFRTETGSLGDIVIEVPLRAFDLRLDWQWHH